MHLYKWIFVAVFPFDGVVGVGGTLSEEREPRHIVAKYDWTVSCGVDTAFHNLTIVPNFAALVKGVIIR